MINFIHSRFKLCRLQNFLQILMDPESYRLKALNELGETAEIKVQKLVEFRSWIAQHDLFRNARQGEKLFYFSPYQFLPADIFGVTRN